jgi:hypothetical protein
MAPPTGLLSLALNANVLYFVAMSVAHWVGFKVPVLFIYYDTPFHAYQDKIIAFCAATYALFFFAATRHRAVVPFAIASLALTTAGLSAINSSDDLRAVLPAGASTSVRIHFLFVSSHPTRVSHLPWNWLCTFVWLPSGLLGANSNDRWAHLCARIASRHVAREEGSGQSQNLSESLECTSKAASFRTCHCVLITGLFFLFFSSARVHWHAIQTNHTDFLCVITSLH